MLRKNPERLKRSRIFYFSLFLILILVGGYLIIALQKLILPIIVGTLLAYIFMPLLNKLNREKVPKAVSLILIFAFLMFSIFFLGKLLLGLVPNDNEKLELRVKLQYNLNELYLDYTGRTDFASKGNFIYEMVGEESNPVVKSINDFFNLTEEEKRHLFTILQSGNADETKKEKIMSYVEQIEKWGIKSKITTDANIKSEQIFNNQSQGHKTSIIATFIDTISNWIIMPLVFLFLLVDEGGIKKFFVNLIPNRYFEMALTTLEKVDEAIGNYLRGTLIECSLVGLTLMLGLILVGFNFEVAVVIGLAAGIANAIPFVGPVIGLAVGIIYALIVDGIDPIIPFLSSDSAILGVVLSVTAAQLMDNVVFQPFILGKAVNLHPLVVVLGITAGSVILGLTGMLLAVPTIVIFKVIISTLYHQLKDYYLIY